MNIMMLITELYSEHYELLLNKVLNDGIVDVIDDNKL